MSVRPAALVVVLAAFTTLGLSPNSTAGVGPADGGATDAGSADAGTLDGGAFDTTTASGGIDAGVLPDVTNDAGPMAADAGDVPDSGEADADAGNGPADLGPPPESTGPAYARFLVGAGAMGAATGLTVAGIAGGLAANDWAASQNPGRDPAQAEELANRAALLGAVSATAAVMATVSGGLGVAGAVWGLVEGE